MALLKMAKYLEVKEALCLQLIFRWFRKNMQSETQMWQNVNNWEGWIQDKMEILCTIFASFP